MKALMLGVLLTTQALAADDLGVPVSVTVLDVAGAPIPTASVRNPEEADRHSVNRETGTWTGNVLYLPDGSEIVFEAGLVLELEISAPGYISQKVTYQVRKRKNRVTVNLEEMDLTEDTDEPDIIIQPGRDKPID